MTPSSAVARPARQLQQGLASRASAFVHHLPDVSLQVQIWDAARCKQIRELLGHTNRVSSLAWANAVLSSGGRDSVINCWDVRKRRDEACVARLESHEQEVRRCVGVAAGPEQAPRVGRPAHGTAPAGIDRGGKHGLSAVQAAAGAPERCACRAPGLAQVCGLKWSPCGQMLASGGNDNALCIWNSSFRLVHKVHAHQVRHAPPARSLLPPWWPFRPAPERM